MATLSPERIVVLIKKQGSQGTDASPVSPTDWLPITDFSLATNAAFDSNPEKLGTGDAAAPQLTTLDPTATLSAIFRGSGAAGTAPRLEALLEIGAFEVVDLSTPIPTVGTTSATGGTTNSITIDTSVDTDWPNTDDHEDVLGCVCELSVNPSPNAFATIISYKMSGAVATVTFDETFGSALDATTDVVRLAARKWQPIDIASAPYGTLYAYQDGNLTKLIDGRADLAFALRAANRIDVSATVRGVYGSPDFSTAALPTPTPDTAIAAKWKAGRFAIDSTRAAIESLQVNMGVTPENPPDPNEADGRGPSEFPSRDITGSLVPIAVLQSTRDLLDKLRTETTVALSARSNEAQAAGLRFSLCIPTATILQRSDQAVGSFLGEAINFDANGSNALGVQITQW